MTVTVLSENANVDLDAVVGKEASFTLHTLEHAVAERLDERPRDPARPPFTERFARSFATLCETKKFAGVDRGEESFRVRFEALSGEVVDLDEISDSERQAVIFAAMFVHLELHHSIVLVDVPELFLPPSTVVRFASAITALGQDNQIIFATSSPELVAAMEPYQVVRLGDGRSIQQALKGMDASPSWLTSQSARLPTSTPEAAIPSVQRPSQAPPSQGIPRPAPPAPPAPPAAPSPSAPAILPSLQAIPEPSGRLRRRRPWCCRRSSRRSRPRCRWARRCRRSRACLRRRRRRCPPSPPRRLRWTEHSHTRGGRRRGMLSSGLASRSGEEARRLCDEPW